MENKIKLRIKYISIINKINIIAFILHIFLIILISFITIFVANNPTASLVISVILLYITIITMIICSMFNIMNFIYILFFDWKNDELNNIKVICGVLTLFLFMLGWIPSIIFVSKIKNTIISSIKEENNTKSNLPSK